MGAWTIEGLTLRAITAAEKCTNARLNVKSRQSHSSAISGSNAPGHSVCLKSMSRTITMQGLTLAAITASQKHTLMQDSM